MREGRRDGTDKSAGLQRLRTSSRGGVPGRLIVLVLCAAVAAGCSSPDGSVCSGELHLGSSGAAFMTVADVQGGGEPEVIVCAGAECNVLGLDCAMRRGITGPRGFSPQMVSDLDGDRKGELIGAALGGETLRPVALNGCGDVIFRAGDEDGISVAMPLGRVAAGVGDVVPVAVWNGLVVSRVMPAAPYGKRGLVAHRPGSPEPLWGFGFPWVPRGVVPAEDNGRQVLLPEYQTNPASEYYYLGERTLGFAAREQVYVTTLSSTGEVVRSVRVSWRDEPLSGRATFRPLEKSSADSHRRETVVLAERRLGEKVFLHTLGLADGEVRRSYTLPARAYRGSVVLPEGGGARIVLAAAQDGAVRLTFLSQELETIEETTFPWEDVELLGVHRDPTTQRVGALVRAPDEVVLVFGADASRVLLTLDGMHVATARRIDGALIIAGATGESVRVAVHR